MEQKRLEEMAQDVVPLDELVREEKESRNNAIDADLEGDDIWDD